MYSPSYIYSIMLLAGTAFVLLLTPSCMNEKPDALPENLEWNPELALPLGEEQFGLNSESGFDTTLLEADSISGLPIWVSRHEVVMEGVFDFDLSTISDNLDKLNRILFRVNSSNQFPHIIYSQAYFRDGTMAIIDSMFLEGPVDTPAGNVNDMGGSIDPGLASHDAIIEDERIPFLVNAQTILFRATFLVDPPDSSLIPVYPTFRFNIDSGVMLDLSFEY